MGARTSFVGENGVPLGCASFLQLPAMARLKLVIDAWLSHPALVLVVFRSSWGHPAVPTYGFCSLDLGCF